MPPSHPPDHTIGPVATSASPRLPCFNSTRRKAWSASRRVKSLTPPLPSVFPTTATTWSAVNWPARMRSSRPEASWTLLSSTFATSTAIAGVSSLSVERSRLHADPVFCREVDSQDCALRVSSSPFDQGGSRIVGGHAALADVGRDVLVAEGDVVPAGVANLVGEYRRRPLRPLSRLVEKSVRHGEAPASVVTPRDIGERPELGLVLFHGAAPYDHIELREVDGLSVQPADHVDVARSGRDVVPVVDRVRAQRVVVPGQDDDRLAQPLELGPHEGDGLVGHAVVIEEVAGDQQQVDLIGQRPIDDALEDAPAAHVMRGSLSGIAAAVAVEMDVGGVKHSQGPS